MTDRVTLAGMQGPSDLDVLAYDWGVRCFGRAHMENPQIRALRMIEEAIETGQVLGLGEALVHLLTTKVFERPRGEVKQELGGTILTTRVLCTTLGLNPEGLYLIEVRRCLSKDPESFTKRNEQKIGLGLDASTDAKIRG